jgi:hypothetical protein
MRGQLRVKGLKYAKLEISDMDVALGEDDDRRRRRLRDMLGDPADRPLLGDDDDDTDFSRAYCGKTVNQKLIRAARIYGGWPLVTRCHGRSVTEKPKRIATAQ